MRAQWVIRDLLYSPAFLCPVPLLSQDASVHFSHIDQARAINFRSIVIAYVSLAHLCKPHVRRILFIRPSSSCDNLISTLMLARRYCCRANPNVSDKHLQVLNWTFWYTPRSTHPYVIGCTIRLTYPVERTLKAREDAVLCPCRGGSSQQKHTSGHQRACTLAHLSPKASEDATSAPCTCDGPDNIMTGRVSLINRV